MVGAEDLVEDVIVDAVVVETVERDVDVNVWVTVVPLVTDVETVDKVVAETVLIEMVDFDVDVNDKEVVVLPRSQNLVRSRNPTFVIKSVLEVVVCDVTVDVDVPLERQKSNKKYKC